MPKLLDYSGAEALTNIRRSTLQAMVCRRQIPFIRIGPRLVRFDEAELIGWLDERRMPARGAAH